MTAYAETGPSRARGLRTSTPPTSAETAYHEAGHAVAALVWGGNVRRVSIVHVKGKHFGICVAGRMPAAHEAIRDAIERAEANRHTGTAGHFREMLLADVRASLAGWCAEFIFSGRRVSISGIVDEGDMESARATLDLAGLPFEYYLEREVRRTMRFLRTNWRHVQTVARALLKHRTLNERRFRALVEKFIGWIPHPKYPPEPTCTFCGRLAAHGGHGLRVRHKDRSCKRCSKEARWKCEHGGWGVLLTCENEHTWTPTRPTRGRKK